MNSRSETSHQEVPVTDPLSDALLAVILACTQLLIVLLPRDPLMRRWLTRRAVRRFQKGVR